MLLRALNPDRCEFTADEIGNRLKLEPQSKQSIHLAAMQRDSQDFEHLTMFFGESLVFGLRGHSISHHGVDGLQVRANHR